MGQVIAPFGIKGWLRVRSFTDEVGGLTNYSQWWLQLASGWKMFSLAESNVGTKGLTARLAEIEDRTQAETLNGAQVAVSRAALPPLADNEFYWADLIGFSVETQGQEKIGILDGLLETSAADVLVVKGDTEHLIPAALIKQVDRNGKQITVDWGLDF